VKYRVTHVTEYLYEERVSTSQHQLHLLPRPAPRQTCADEELSVTPAPALRRDRVDDFGNRCTYLEIHAPHQELRVVARSQIAVDAGPPAAASPAQSPPWEEVRDAVAAAGDPALFEARAFVFPSPHVPASAAARAYAAASFTPGRPLVQAALELTGRIYDQFTYDAEATTVSTSIEEVLQHRRGVCQDFAHLQLACLRALGLPARYMSGYLITARAAGEPRVVGADASHAWLSVFCPGLGWLPLDPTNATTPAGRHITVAWGRDFSDVTPMRGVVVGGGAHALTVSVDVAPMS
jgi:transglutaminase-like putative cysteine protease